MLINLTQNQVALIDDEDFLKVKDYKWHTNKIEGHLYAATTIRKDNGKQAVLFMHRLLMGNPKTNIDHKNGNGLDNQKENLRLATTSQNAMNQTQNGGSSDYKGVTWHKRDKVWQATIVFERKNKFLGSFKDEIEAAKAYDQAAEELFGEYAKLNFPKGV